MTNNQRKALWHFTIHSPGVTMELIVQAIDPRDALSRALTTTLPSGKLLGDAAAVPIEALQDAPGNADRAYRVRAGKVGLLVQALDDLQGESLKNVLGQPAEAPFYVWANEDCANSAHSFKAAKVIRRQLVNDGAFDVYIADAGGAEVIDAEIEAHEALAFYGFFAGLRDPRVRPGHQGAYMVNDPRDADGFAIVGDDIGRLIVEACAHHELV